MTTSINDDAARNNPPLQRVSLSAKPIEKSKSNPSLSRWTTDQVREGIVRIAELVVSGQLDSLGSQDNLNDLAEISRWTTKDDQALLKKQLKEVLARLQKLQQPADKPTHIDHLSQDDIAAGEELAKGPDIFQAFNQDLETLGFPVAERFSASILMALTARLLDHSTAHIIYGASASGKSAVSNTALTLLLPTQYKSLTAMSSLAGYYLGDIKNLVLALGELKPLKPGEDDEKQMALRQLVSENKISRAIPEKVDGKMELSEKVTEGPCVITASTTCDSQAFNDEWANRCYWIQSDDSEDTTKKALSVKAKRAARQDKTTREALTKLRGKWQAYNASLQPLPVVIPYAEMVIPASAHVTVRRLFDLLLDYVRVSALLHQKTRDSKSYDSQDCVVASTGDYKLALELLLQNAPKTLENCGDRAYEAFSKAKSDLVQVNKFKQVDLERILKQPRSTVQGYLRQWQNAGLVTECEKSYGNSKLYQVESVNLLRQDLGLVTYETLANNLGDSVSAECAENTLGS